VGLSSRVEYAFLALMELADNYNAQSCLKIGEIAERHSLPERYLEQILSALRREGIVQSIRGARGGYVLVREPWKITLQQVITTIDGDDNKRELELSEPSTVEKTVIYEVWSEANQAFQSIFSTRTIQDLCQQRDAYRQDNTMYYI